MTDHPTEYLKFFFIPSCALLNENLSYAAALLFSTIFGLIKGNGKCTAQNAYFRRFMRRDCSDAYIQKCLASLEDEGYITREMVKNRIIDDNGKVKFETHRVIKICTTYEARHAELIPELGPLGKKVLDNNEIVDVGKPIVKGGKNPILSVDSNRIYNKVSKDTKGENPPVDKKLLFLLDEWRTKDTTPKKQKHPKEGSKLHKKIAYLTTLLMNGKFGSVCDLKPEFLEQNNLTKEKINYKYSEDELLAGLDEMAEMFKLNNLPENKEAIEKMDFASLIYHPVAKMSYLLKYLWNDVQELSFKTVQVYGHWLDKLYEERIFDKDIENDHHQFGILKKGLAGIEEYYSWMYMNPMAEVSCDVYRQIESEDKFYNFYIKWLENYTTISPYGIGPQSNRWYEFIKWLEEAIHGDFKHQYPTLDKRKHNK